MDSSAAIAGVIAVSGRHRRRQDASGSTPGVDDRPAGRPGDRKDSEKEEDDDETLLRVLSQVRRAYSVPCQLEKAEYASQFVKGLETYTAEQLTSTSSATKSVVTSVDTRMISDCRPRIAMSTCDVAIPSRPSGVVDVLSGIRRHKRLQPGDDDDDYDDDDDDVNGQQVANCSSRVHPTHTGHPDLLQGLKLQSQRIRSCSLDRIVSVPPFLRPIEEEDDGESFDLHPEDDTSSNSSRTQCRGTTLDGVADENTTTAAAFASRSTDNSRRLDRQSDSGPRGGGAARAEEPPNDERTDVVVAAANELLHSNAVNDQTTTTTAPGDHRHYSSVGPPSSSPPPPPPPPRPPVTCCHCCCCRPMLLFYVIFASFAVLVACLTTMAPSSVVVVVALTSVVTYNVDRM